MESNHNKAVAVSIDIENDWGGRINAYQGIQEGLPFILDTLKGLDIKATFFVSGEVVRDNKDAFNEIRASGHEIASHGFTHNVDYSKLSKEELSAQISRSRESIENELGISPLGFRAPKFGTSAHLFSILSDLQFKYDSSMVRGILPSRYSSLSVPSEPFFKNDILEIPISTLPYLKVPMGLLWINAIGFGRFRFLAERMRLPEIIVLYMHPFDLVQNKSKNDFGFLVNRWYTYKTDTTRHTLISILDYLKSKNREFICLRDLLSRNGIEIERKQGISV